jgi:mannose-6-phosphate isomerase-like protein (cupin superfamily)
MSLLLLQRQLERVEWLDFKRIGDYSMHAVKFEDAEVNLRSGNRMIVPKALTETLEAGLVVRKKGEGTPLASHPDEEEIYIILKGKGRIRVGDEWREVSPNTALYIPRNALHEIQCISEEPLEYIYIANWPDTKGIYMS